MPIATFKLRRGTASEWTTANPVLGDGEPGFEKNTFSMKIGNGVTAWKDLPYFFSFANLVTALSSVFAPKSVETTVTSGRLSPTTLAASVSTQIANEAPVSVSGANAGDIPIWDNTVHKYLPGPAPAGGGSTDVEVVPIRFSAETPTTGPTGSDRASYARTVTEARMRVGSAPVGSDLSVDVQHWNGTTWSTIITLTVVNGSTTEAVNTSLSQAQAVGNLLRLNVNSVGSTTAAKDVVVDVVVV